MPKMVFFCNIRPKESGSFEAFIVRLAEAWRGAGGTLCYVLAAPPPVALGERLAAAGASVGVIRGWEEPDGTVHPWRFTGGARRTLRQQKPDVAVVHFGNELPTLVAAMIGRVASPKTRWIWQQDQAMAPAATRWTRRSRIALLHSCCSAMVAVSNAIADAMRQRGIPANKIHVIHNGVAAATPGRPIPRQPLGAGETDVVLCTVGTLIARKRHSFLMNVLRRLREDGVPAVLWIVGDGPERKSLDGQAESAGVKDSVVFLGRRDDVDAVLAAADIFVHAAEREGCCYALLESMAAGLPAVTAEGGAAREQVVDDKSGYVVTGGDEDGFVARVKALAVDREFRKAMGRQAYVRWQQQFTLDRMVERYIALYRQVAEGK